MTAHQAQSKLNEVYDFLMSFEGMINPDNIRFSRWLRDAQALRKSNPAEGFLMEALVYRLQGKLYQAVEYAEKSYRIDKMIACDNYATILSNAGRFEEAIELDLANLQKDNFNKYALHRLIVDSSITLNKNALSQGLALFKDPNDQSNELIALGNDYLEQFVQDEAILKQANVSIDVYRKVKSIAARAISTYYLGDSAISMNIQYNEVGTCVILTEKLKNVDMDDCFTIHDKYIDDLIDSDLSFKDYKRIVYNFLPLEDEDLTDSDIGSQQGILV